MVYIVYLFFIIRFISCIFMFFSYFFFFQAEDGIRDYKVTGVQTCALPIFVSPDGPLLLLSFEALLTGPAPPGRGYAGLPYLIRQRSITYVPSASVLAELGEIGRASCRERGESGGGAGSLKGHRRRGERRQE